MDENERTTKGELAIAVWETLDCESVGAKELELIQLAIAKRFGEGAVASPASLARTLADEGAVLRHPEVLECDARWRESKVSQSLVKAQLGFASIAEAPESLAEFESLRKEFARAGDNKGLRELRDAVIQTRHDRLLFAGSSVVSEIQRAEAHEIARWLDVWLRTPELFADWLELRRASPEFRKRFGA